MTLEIEDSLGRPVSSDSFRFSPSSWIESRRGLLRGEKYVCLPSGMLIGDTSEEGEAESVGDEPDILRTSAQDVV